MMYVRFLTNISHYVLIQQKTWAMFVSYQLKLLKIFSETTGLKDLFHCIIDVCEIHTSISHLILFW